MHPMLVAFLDSDWALIFVFAAIVLVFGGSQLPKLAKGMGEAAREFRRGQDATSNTEPPGEPAAQAMPGQQAILPPAQEQIQPGQPVQGQPVYQQPVQGQPVQGQPVYQQPVQGQPVQGQPMAREDVASE